jgi:arginase family enzyme
VDVLDPTAMPAKDHAPPGPGLAPAELGDLLARLLGASRAAALLLAGFNPLRDSGGHSARLLIRLLAQALGREAERA